MKLLSVRRIWDQAEHNALPDLIFYRGRWFCALRESDKHEKGINGSIRVICSDDLLAWKSAWLFVEEGIDLRDPKFSVAPHGELLLQMQGVKRDVSQQMRVAFSPDGFNWPTPRLSFEPREWPWRITWHEQRAYAVSYRIPDPKKKRGEPWIVSLCASDDALHFEKVCTWDIDYYASEATIRFLPAGAMVVLIRRCGKDLREWNAPNWIGISRKPFVEWKWQATTHHLGGPNFVVLKNGNMCAAGRIVWATPYGLMEKTVVGRMTLNEIYPELMLPSGGDCSYPGMVCQGDHLYIAYYSSHEEKTAIYLATLKI